MRATFVFLAAIIFGWIPSFAQAPQIQWLKCLGGSNTESCYSIDKTEDGYILVGFTGSSDGDVTGFIGQFDVWVIKVDTGGIIQWQKCLGGSDTEQGICIQQTSDGGYVLAAHTQSDDGDITGSQGSEDFWVVKLDASGSLQWQKCLGGTAIDLATGVRQTPDGGYLVCGTTLSSDGDVSINHGGGDCWILKLDGSGNLLWEKTYGGTLNESATEIIQTSDSGYVVTGTTSSNDGDVSGNHGNSDVWIFKIDSTGNLQWQKAYGGSDGETSNFISEISSGGFIISGSSMSIDGDVTVNHGGRDCWLLEVDSIGTLIWQQSFGGSGDDQAYTVLPCNNGGYIFAGPSDSNDGDVTGNHGANDAWIVRTADNGALLWEKSIGGTSPDIALCIWQNTDGSFIIGGYAISNNGDISGSHGGQDLLLTKLEAETFNIVTGKIFADLNNNNIQDAGDPNISYQRVNENLDGNSFFSGYDGVYHVVCDMGNYLVSPGPLNHFTAAPILYSGNFPSLQMTDSLKDFAFQPGGTFNDLQISITPTNAPRPARTATYFIKYKNVGTTSMNATVVFNWDSAHVKYVSADVMPSFTGSDSVAWTNIQLNPFEQGIRYVTIRIDSNESIGATISASSYIAPIQGDTVPFDNTDAFETEVIAAHDPNDKIVTRHELANTEVAAGVTLGYVIRFQNTGNDTAFTVAVQDTLSALLDMNTFKFVSSSHPVEISYTGANRLLKFQFNNILLPDSTTDEPSSHGFIHYRIRPYGWVMAGSMISNEASIYFDLNAPVITNEALTVVMDPLSDQSMNIHEAQILLSPNPTTREVTLRFSDNMLHDITLFNLHGNALIHSTGSEKINLDLSDLASGIYFISVKDEKNNVVVKKVVKL